MVTHHGLPNSNNPALVMAIDPVVAVMCNGPTKGGHEKTQQTLRKVESLKHLYQLHQNVKLAADQQTPGKFTANVGKLGECEGVFVKMSVESDGTSYTVQIWRGWPSPQVQDAKLSESDASLVSGQRFVLDLLF